MNIKCPGCGKKKENISSGKYKCDSCGAKFIASHIKGVEIINLEKNNYWVIFDVLLIPCIVIYFKFIKSERYFDNFILGLYLLFMPIVVSGRSALWHQDFTIPRLYKYFFLGKLDILDKVSKVAAYFLIITNLVGLTVTIISII